MIQNLVQVRYVIVHASMATGGSRHTHRGSSLIRKITASAWDFDSDEP